MKQLVEAVLTYGIAGFFRKYIDFLKHRRQVRLQGLAFDIILSVGPACRSGFYLKKHSLRFCAAPLDWMMRYSLETAVHLYKTRFADFFVDFVQDSKQAEERKLKGYFVDTRNQITSIHYSDVGNNNGQPFREKMKNRFEKVNKLLLKADDICFLSNRNEDVSLIKNFLNEMGKMYQGKITYINIRHDRTKDFSAPPPHKYYSEKLSDRLKLIEFEFYDVHPLGGDKTINEDFWLGNPVEWDNVMEKIKLKRNLKFLRICKNNKISNS
ncbi:MAG: papain-like cysteine peptidase [Elusimicrobiota bacterium]|jgi:hypothetical protein|nr:papain-like cysteine peptidase [Elusimicrobiota bacterium]